MSTPLSSLNGMSREQFVAVCGGLFEHSPWIADRTWPQRPFASVEALHAALVATVAAAPRAEQIALIAAHPDLVGRLAKEGRLTQESTAEQRAAGLSQLSPEESAAFDRYNIAYREKFGFPFVICARENKKEAILAAFPARLNHHREQEIAAALAEIAQIARLRLLDAVTKK
jgi:OHCU decarboxylase